MFLSPAWASTLTSRPPASSLVRQSYVGLKFTHGQHRLSILLLPSTCLLPLGFPSWETSLPFTQTYRQKPRIGFASSLWAIPQIYPLYLYFFHLPWYHRGPVAIFSHLGYSCSLLTLLPASTTAPTVYAPPAARGVILRYKLDCVFPILKILPWLPIMLIKTPTFLLRAFKGLGLFLSNVTTYHST